MRSFICFLLLLLFLYETSPRIIYTYPLGHSSLFPQDKHNFVPGPPGITFLSFAGSFVTTELAQHIELVAGLNPSDQWNQLKNHSTTPYSCYQDACFNGEDAILSDSLEAQIGIIVDRPNDSHFLLFVDNQRPLLTETRGISAAGINFDPNTIGGKIVYYLDGNNPIYFFTGGRLSDSQLNSQIIELNYVENGACLLNPSSPYAREGHSAVFTTFYLSGSGRGRIILFGGVDTNGPTNDLMAFDLGSTICSAGSTLSTLSFANPPSARYYHSMFGTFSQLYLFGGKTSESGGYLGDTWLLDLTTSTWTNLGLTVAPSARAGAAVVPDPTQQNSWYLYGGENGNTYFNDIWHFNGTSWERLDYFNKPASGVAYHSGLTHNGNLLFYGGRFGPNNTTNLMRVFTFTCPWRCGEMCFADTSTSPCVKITNCFESPTVPYQCRTDCFGTPTCSASSCPGAVACWDGTCAATIKDCTVFPSCQIGQKRCNDGTCVNPGVSCSTVTCPSGTELCANGQCLNQCFRHLGCLPDDKPLLCRSGKCVADLDDCDLQCGNLTYCAFGCAESCGNEEPLWNIAPIEEISWDTPFCFQGTNINCLVAATQSRFFCCGRVYVEYQSLNPIVPVYLFMGSTPSPHFRFPRLGERMKGRVRTVTPSEFSTAGPYPLWTAEFEPHFISSVVLDLELDSEIGTQILFYHILRSGEEYINSSNALVFYTRAYCMATVVPWYWDLTDELATSPLRDLPYITQYRQMRNGTLTINLQDIVTPSYRWKCIDEVETSFPLWAEGVGNNVHSSIGGMIPSNFTGWIALISREYNSSLASNSDETLPPLPPESEAQYVLMGVAGAIILILVIVVIYKKATEKH